MLLTNLDGISLIDHDGTIQYENIKPTGDSLWMRPAAIHDFDGDGIAEYATSSDDHYAVYEASGAILWSALVDDESGLAAGTAFDFLGDGKAEAMYADENTLWAFDDNGAPHISVPRSSRTFIEYPVVADVDNDGSGEIVVVSELGYDNVQTAPTVQVYRDADDRWIQPRRIWNQHTYHVTNVREDGTIPQFEPRHWERLNTFRTNAQIEGGSVCQPRPAG